MRAASVTAVLAAVLAATLMGCAPEAPGAETGPVEPSEAATTAPVETPTTTPDPYAGYFDDRVGDAPAFASFAGSFGDVGAVAPVRNDARAIAPGRYDVEVVCVGPSTGVDVTLTSIADETVLRDVTVGCSADGIVGRTDTIELAGKGLRVELDSGGETGAYFVAVRDAGA